MSRLCFFISGDIELTVAFFLGKLVNAPSFREIELPDLWETAHGTRDCGRMLNLYQYLHEKHDRIDKSVEYNKAFDTLIRYSQIHLFGYSYTMEVKERNLKDSNVKASIAAKNPEIKFDRHGVAMNDTESIIVDGITIYQSDVPVEQFGITESTEEEVMEKWRKEEQPMTTKQHQEKQKIATDEEMILPLKCTECSNATIPLGRGIYMDLYDCFDDVMALHLGSVDENNSKSLRHSVRRKLQEVYESCTNTNSNLGHSAGIPDMRPQTFFSS